MGCWIVEIQSPQAKSGLEGWKHPCDRKRSRRAGRRHREGTRCSRMTGSTVKGKGVARGLEPRAPRLDRPPPPKREDRKTAHSVRAYEWAFDAAERLAARACHQRLIEGFPRGAQDMTWRDFITHLRIRYNNTHSVLWDRSRLRAEIRSAHRQWLGVYRHTLECGVDPRLGCGDTYLGGFLYPRAKHLREGVDDWLTHLGTLARRYQTVSPGRPGRFIPPPAILDRPASVVCRRCTKATGVPLGRTSGRCPRCGWRWRGGPP